MDYAQTHIEIISWNFHRGLLFQRTDKKLTISWNCDVFYHLK